MDETELTLDSGMFLTILGEIGTGKTVTAKMLAEDYAEEHADASVALFDPFVGADKTVSEFVEEPTGLHRVGLEDSTGLTRDERHEAYNDAVTRLHEVADALILEECHHLSETLYTDLKESETPVVCTSQFGPLLSDEYADDREQPPVEVILEEALLFIEAPEILINNFGVIRNALENYDGVGEREISSIMKPAIDNYPTRIMGVRGGEPYQAYVSEYNED